MQCLRAAKAADDKSSGDVQQGTFAEDARNYKIDTQAGQTRFLETPTDGDCLVWAVMPSRNCPRKAEVVAFRQKVSIRPNLLTDSHCSAFAACTGRCRCKSLPRWNHAPPSLQAVVSAGRVGLGEGIGKTRDARGVAQLRQLLHHRISAQPAFVDRLIACSG